MKTSQGIKVIILYLVGGTTVISNQLSVCLNVTYGYEANVNLMVVLKPEDHQSHSDSSSGNHPSSGCRDISLEK